MWSNMSIGKCTPAFGRRTPLVAEAFGLRRLLPIPFDVFAQERHQRKVGVARRGG